EATCTVADFVATEIEDPVADILKLTIPELVRADEILTDTTGREAVFPDDGLESYDDKFVFT
ncbi:MAG: hypothetical protein LBV63_05405, partial [Candidatus Methanoplasma sp.]|nr:hypothetical protein [Candidatus Methanoplasma sp.]